MPEEKALKRFEQKVFAKKEIIREFDTKKMAKKRFTNYDSL